jgi:hypothetical protein
MVLKEHCTTFGRDDLASLCLISKDFVNIVPKVIHWLQVDFSTLCNLRLGYEQQDYIDPHHVEMASMVMIHFGLDPGKFVHFLSGEYMGQYRNI